MVHDLTIIGAFVWLLVSAISVMLTGLYSSRVPDDEDDIAPGVFYLVGAVQLSAAIVVAGMIGA